MGAVAIFAVILRERGALERRLGILQGKRNGRANVSVSTPTLGPREQAVSVFYPCPHLFTANFDVFHRQLLGLAVSG